MKKLFLAGAAALALSLCASAQVKVLGDRIAVNTANNSLILSARSGSSLGFLHFGARLSDADIEALQFAGVRPLNAYPAYGQGEIREDAIAVTHPDGNMSLDLVVENVITDSSRDTDIACITLKDKVYDFRVKVYYKAFKDVDMIETWTEIVNDGKKPVVLRKFDSAFLPFHTGDVWVSHLYGTWANEGRLVEEPLQRGTLRIENKDGVRNSHTSHAEIMISLDGKPSENTGSVIGAALCYSGNYHLDIITNDTDYHRLFAGISPDNSTLTLDKGESFRTPELAITFSDEGLSGASRNFHRWARAHKIAHGDRERKILLNSWEGVYFNINEPGMDQMMGDIASMGGELFVMDDGWFGDKYPRLNDSSSLGDWVVDKNKLPNGVGGLVETARKHGISFGIWIEPEMANTVSELYEKHPDWIINAPGRDVVKGRGGSQVVLDLSNPAVQDYVFSIVDNLMTDYPGIDYIKWDANMSVSSHGSSYLPADRQSELNIRYHQGFAAVCDRIRAKYPDLTIQACASGGGRASYGVLPWFDEFWVSDNTDALQRIYMQWGTSYFFPSITMASHISAVPNHTVYRVTPLKFRIDVAMSGRLGMELQPKDMTPEEIAQCKQAIADYKSVRPVVQFGDIYRLVSPYDNLGVASMMYVGQDKSEAVFYWWRIDNMYDSHLPRVKMAGLDPDRNYRIVELDKAPGRPLSFEGRSFSGSFLMDVGLEMPGGFSRDLQGYASRVLHLIAE
ncbi:MAG: alpha-galactosidase [Bacteroidales bacterium]|nr:alpha-galactosidase [Bacteroidales bacterium]